MLSSLFSKIYAEEQRADDKEAAKAEEPAEEKTEETPAEAEAEAEEPEDVSYRRQVAPRKIVEKCVVTINSEGFLLTSLSTSLSIASPCYPGRMWRDF